jgi:hypothetical protein
MSARHGRDKHIADEELEITAQPKSMPEELGVSGHQEPGLSVDPEDLGRQFLGDAMEQGNYESSRGGDGSDMWVNSAASSDEALPGPNFEGDRSIWENTVSLAMQSGGTDGAQANVAPSLPSADDDEDEIDDDDIDEHDADIDLTEGAIHDGSLLDHEGAELGETESPEINTDDTGSHAKKRGGHPPKGARSQHRAR